MKQQRVKVDREVFGGGCGSAMGQQPGAAAAVVVEFIDVDGTLGRGEQLGLWNMASERVAAVWGLRRSSPNAVGRVCGGLPLPETLCGMSRGWSGTADGP